MYDFGLPKTFTEFCDSHGWLTEIVPFTNNKRGIIFILHQRGIIFILHQRGIIFILHQRGIIFILRQRGIIFILYQRGIIFMTVSLYVYSPDYTNSTGKNFTQKKCCNFLSEVIVLSLFSFCHQFLSQL